MIKLASLQTCKDGLTLYKLINVFHYKNRYKEKNHIIIPIIVEKGFDKSQYPSVIRFTEILGIEGSYF